MGFEFNSLLEVDLGARTARIRRIDDKVLAKYLGGRALGGKLLYDYLRPGVDPLSPDNCVFVLTGPVTGTLVPCSGKYAVVTKSPLTGAFLDSYASGVIGPEIRYCGLAGIVVTGRAEIPTYLYVRDCTVEFRDARRLWGMSTISAEESIAQETDQRAGIMVIGPAGERLVRIAGINSDHYRQAARGGAGAVLGSKNLKGIAVLGTGCVEVAHPERIKEMFLEHLERLRKSVVGQARKKYGTPMTLDITNRAGMLPVRNFQRSSLLDAVDNIDGSGVARLTTKSRACWGCPIGCSKITRVPDGRFSGDVVEGPEYETLGLLGANLGISYLPAVIRANILCDELGLDTISAGGCVSFIMECYEKGLVSAEEVGVNNPVFGNHEAALALIEKIAYREGIGDLLAEGVKRSAGRIGKGAHKFAMHVKGMEFPAYEPRAAYGACLAYAVSPRGACHRRAWPPAKEVLGGVPPFTTDGKAEMVKGLFDDNMVLHSLLICDFPNKFADVGIGEFAEYLTCVTGRRYSASDLYEIADRGETQIRLFNVREGFSRADDTLPDRVFDEPLPDGPGKGNRLTREALDKMLDDYYEARGWDKAGDPLPETLRLLGITERSGGGKE